MAFERNWVKIFTWIGIFSLFFLIIPIPFDVTDTVATEHEFHKFLKKYNKTYYVNTTEYRKRLVHFQESLKLIKKLNNERTSNSSALFGLTPFSDLSVDEFLQQHLQRTLHDHVRQAHSRREKEKHHNHVKRAVPANLPLKVDWRTKNVVTAVKDQKTCGACWAFSTVEVVESMQAISKGKLENLSVQEAIDCAGDGNMGCDGGDMCSLVEWMVEKKTGLVPEAAYPLHLKTEACHLVRNVTSVQVSPSYSCDSLVGDENRLLSLLAFHGPVAVAVNALTWQNYLGGVIHFHCSSATVNHAVQIIGYDLTAPVPFYIVRNSWGTKYGDAGYLYLAVGGNICGVATEVVSLDVL